MLTYLKKLITGLSIHREYVPISLENFSDSFRVCMTSRGSEHHTDVTSNNILLGYRPLIFGMVSAAGATAAEEICLHFNLNEFHTNTMWEGFGADQKSIARLRLRRVTTKFLDDKQLTLYEGVNGRHEFLHRVHRVVNDIRARFRKQKIGNVDLPGNLYDQVRIAYAVPRIISIITVSDGSKVNLFPTDLHGAVSPRHFVSSLRKNGKANQQVEQYRKLVVTEVKSTDHVNAHALGKNHMRELSDRSTFDLSVISSERFQFPLPAGALRYRELTLKESIDLGIHRIHIYDVINHQHLTDGQTLAHIHQYVAQWREDNGLPTENNS